jgi:spore maturation protein B
MTNYIIPIFILLIIIYATIKKVDCFNAFVEGSHKGLKLVWDIFPYILAILVAVELFRVSGLANFMINAINPLFTFLGIPAEVVELVFLRPFTGGGSVALLSDIYATHGPDSYAARCASVIMGSSETIFFVSAVYFSKTTPKKLLPAIIIALITALLGAILSCLIVKIM